jgi:hypothetical protein
VNSRPLKWIAASALVVVAFLATIAQSYHPPYGFTSLIEFTQSSHESEIPAVRDTPHFDHPPPSGYDGQFYAQMAVDPLLRDPAIDIALDNPPYRARRILFSWTAYALGLGRPAWILQAYALQNVAAWLALAWILTRWIRPEDARGFALWMGCMMAHGLLMSVQFALPDGAGLLLIAFAVIAVEDGRPLVAALVLGLAGLARETNLLAAGVLARVERRRVRSWLLVGGCLLLCALPLALWIDYLRSIYRSRVLDSADNITLPFWGLWWKSKIVARELAHHPKLWSFGNAASLLAFVAQGVWVTWAWLVRRDRSPWTLVAVAFFALGLVGHPVVWNGNPGAFTRVCLPMTIGANVLLARWPEAPVWLIGLVNLSVLPGVFLMTATW